MTLQGRLTLIHPALATISIALVVFLRTDHSYLPYSLVGFEKNAATWALPDTRQKPVREVAHGGDQAESRPKNTFQKAGKGIERRTVRLRVLKNKHLGVGKDGNTLGKSRNCFF